MPSPAYDKRLYGGTGMRHAPIPFIDEARVIFPSASSAEKNAAPELAVLFIHVERLSRALAAWLGWSLGSEVASAA